VSEFNQATVERARRLAEVVEATTKSPALASLTTLTPSSDVVVLYEALIGDVGLRQASRKLFHDGHYAEAVRRGCVYLNNTLKKRSGIAGKDGADLANHVFGLPNAPLKLNQCKTESDRDEQDGYRMIFGGVWRGLRNPRAHESIEDDPEAALEMLVMINHLLRVLARAKRSRRTAAA
jgi:uncharacterized protein (TIGR02391 family)